MNAALPFGDSFTDKAMHPRFLVFEFSRESPNGKGNTIVET
jgi:hypothetical protein